MKTIHRLVTASALTSFATGGWLLACDDTPTAAVYIDAAVEASTSESDASTTDGSTTDATADASSVVSFTVPTGGGSVDVSTAAGTLSFGFPASAAGKNITFAPSTAASVGLTAAQALAVVKMSPEGERFADPIVLKLSNASTGPLYTMPESATKVPGSYVAYNKAVSGYLVYHFSTLVIAPSGEMCEAPVVQDTPDSGRCTNGSASTQRVVTCPSTPACISTQVSCCYDPSTDAGSGCPTAPFSTTFAPTESTHGGREPQCTVSVSGDSGVQCSGSLGYTYAEANGCEVNLSCGDLTFYLKCDGSTCNCQTFPSGTVTKSFSQGASCDNVGTMKRAYVDSCGYPTP